MSKLLLKIEQGRMKLRKFKDPSIWSVLDFAVEAVRMTITKKLINKCSHVKNTAVPNRKSMKTINYLGNRSIFTIGGDTQP